MKTSSNADSTVSTFRPRGSRQRLLKSRRAAAAKAVTRLLKKQRKISTRKPNQRGKVKSLMHYSSLKEDERCGGQTQEKMNPNGFLEIKDSSNYYLVGPEKINSGGPANGKLEISSDSIQSEQSSRRTSSRVRKPSWKVISGKQETTNGSLVPSVYSNHQSVKSMEARLRDKRKKPDISSESKCSVQSAVGEDNIPKKRTAGSLPEAGKRLDIDIKEELKVPKLIVNLKDNSVVELDRLENNETRKLICLCETNENVYAKQDESFQDQKPFCQAVDVYFKDGIANKVGCLNVISGTILHRSSNSSPFRFLCSRHKKRLIFHQCCPICGLFCVQDDDIFLCVGESETSNTKHFYHKACSESCPHCGNSEKRTIVDVSLRIKGRYKPLLISEVSPRLSSLFRKKVASFEDVQSTSHDKDSSMVIDYFEQESYEILHSAFDNIPTKVDISDETFLAAVDALDFNTIVRLLVKGADPDIRFHDRRFDTACHHAIRKNSHPLVHILAISGADLNLKNEDDFTPIMLASALNHHMIVSYMIACGCDLSLTSSGVTNALHIACRYGSLESAKVLLESCSELLLTKDADNLTPLMVAVKYGKSSVIKFLIGSIHDRLEEQKDKNGNWSLHWCAASKKGTEMIPFILKKCEQPWVAINQRNEKGETPLFVAVKKGLIDNAIILILHGADPYLQDDKGLTPSAICTDEFKDLLHNSEKLSTLLRIGDAVPFLESSFIKDISFGKEKYPIRIAYSIEDFPMDFIYVVSNVYCDVQPDISSHSGGCGCVSVMKTCSSQCPCNESSQYDFQGRLNVLLQETCSQTTMEIFECSQSCGCHWRSCNNHVVQCGIQASLQIFFHSQKKWSVRTQTKILKGSFVCELVGEVITSLEAGRRLESDAGYYFLLYEDENISLVLNSKRYGNVGRFINHSCSGNLAPVRVYHGKESDKRFPRVALFAVCDVFPGQELTYDYGEAFEFDAANCFCNSSNCRFRTSGCG